VDWESDTTGVGPYPWAEKVRWHGVEAGRLSGIGGRDGLGNGSQTHDDIVDNVLVCWLCLYVELRGLRGSAGSRDGNWRRFSIIWCALAAHADILQEERQ
jgi:hypothetical protein